MNNEKVSQVRQGEETYIVDYDLPDDNRRRRFYRAIPRYLRDNYLEDAGKSSQSVMITKNEKFARFIHQEALAVGGTATVWRATKIV